MTDSKISSLDVTIRMKVLDMIAHLEKEKIKYKILETRRSPAVQEAYYAQGRENYARVCSLRDLAGLPKISEADAQRIITWTKKSRHIDGMAIDIVPIIDGKIPWNVKDAETAEAWFRIGRIGEFYGLEWGGRWSPFDKFKIGRDGPHYEL